MATSISRTLRRAVLESRSSLPPTFLLPWTANLSTIPHTSEGVNVPPPNTAQPLQEKQNVIERSLPKKIHTSFDTTSPPSEAQTSDAPAPLPPPGASITSPLELSPQLRELLPLMRAQGPHYITAHIYQKPYLLTQGDTLRLPFYMKGVEPGDVIRLDKATILGSRDYTLKAGGAVPKLKSATMDTTEVLDPTTGSLVSHSRVMPEGELAGGKNAVSAPHFIPHIAKGKVSYLDDKLFICRAVVMGVESEPLRIKEKTKRRNRKVKHVKSKHRYTVLKIKELTVRSAEELEGADGTVDVD